MNLRYLATIKWKHDRSTKTVVAAAVFLLLAFGMGFAPVEPAPLRILLLGDSITQGTKAEYTYRYFLWRDLVDTGIQFDFIGSSKNNYDGNPDWPGHKGRSFDSDHEGHGGWTADEILEGRDKKKNSLPRWLNRYTPDVALVHIGTNDVGRLQDTSTTEEEIRRIIVELRKDNPEVIILLAKLIPLQPRHWDNEKIKELNERIGEIGIEMNTPSSPMIIVDQYTGFSAQRDLLDGVHPNRRGQKKMASRWFAALRPVIDDRLAHRVPGV